MTRSPALRRPLARTAFHGAVSAVPAALLLASLCAGAPGTAQAQAQVRAQAKDGCGEVTVRAGQTLTGIAKEAGVAVETLFDANRDRLASPDRIGVGQSLRLPCKAAAEAEAEAPADPAAPATPEPERERDDAAPAPTSEPPDDPSGALPPRARPENPDDAPAPPPASRPTPLAPPPEPGPADAPLPVLELPPGPGAPAAMVRDAIALARAALADAVPGRALLTVGEVEARTGAGDSAVDQAGNGGDEAAEEAPQEQTPAGEPPLAPLPSAAGSGGAPAAPPADPLAALAPGGRALLAYPVWWPDCAALSRLSPRDAALCARHDASRPLAVMRMAWFARADAVPLDAPPPPDARICRAEGRPDADLAALGLAPPRARRLAPADDAACLEMLAQGEADFASLPAAALAEALKGSFRLPPGLERRPELERSLALRAVAHGGSPEGRAALDALDAGLESLARE